MQATPSAVQPGGVPTCPPGGVATKSQQYATPLSSKPAPVVPSAGVSNATVTSNYSGPLSDGFKSMHLQVWSLLLLIDGTESQTELAVSSALVVSSVPCRILSSVSCAV